MERPFSYTLRRRLNVLSMLFLLCLLTLLTVLLNMQVFAYDEYRERVESEITVGSSLKAERGNIYDRNGVLLATSVTTYRIYLSPVDVGYLMRNGRENVDAVIADGLSKLLSVSYDTVLKRARRTSRLDETVLKNATKSQADAVNAFASENGLLSCVHTEATVKRYYPFSSRAAQTIGFTGNDNQQNCSKSMKICAGFTAREKGILPPGKAP